MINNRVTKLFGIEFIARKNAKNELDLIPIYLDCFFVEIEI